MLQYVQLHPNRPMETLQQVDVSVFVLLIHTQRMPLDSVLLLMLALEFHGLIRFQNIVFLDAHHCH